MPRSSVPRGLSHPLITPEGLWLLTAHTWPARQSRMHFPCSAPQCFLRYTYRTLGSMCSQRSNELQIQWTSHRSNKQTLFSLHVFQHCTQSGNVKFCAQPGRTQGVTAFLPADCLQLSCRSFLYPWDPRNAV